MRRDLPRAVPTPNRRWYENFANHKSGYSFWSSSIVDRPIRARIELVYIGTSLGRCFFGPFFLTFG